MKARIDAILAEEKPVRAFVKPVRGCPRLFINDEIVYPLLVWSWDLPQYTPAFARAGIDLINPYYQLSDAWVGADRYDWSRFDGFIYDILAQNPNAYFLPRILLPAPEWWKEQHPDELVEYAHQPRDQKHGMDIPIRGQGGIIAGWGSSVQASYASEKWRQDTARALSALMQHVEDSMLNRRIFGYQIGNGTTLGEWHYFGAHYLPDMSEPMQKRVGYCPNANERLQTTFGLFRDPQQEKGVIDYYRRFNEVCAETVLYFCRLVKQQQRRLICGTFDDYLLESIWIQESGHLASEKLLNSAFIDFIAAPYSYQRTNVKEKPYWKNNIIDGAGNLLGRARGVAGDGGYRPLLESLRRHGKLHIVEIDPSTYVEKNKFHNGGAGSRTRKGTMKILQRDLGKMFVTGSGGWMTDHGPRSTTGWYAAEPIVEQIRHFSTLGTGRKSLNLNPVAKIAAVYDAKSFYVTQHWKNADYFKGSNYFDFFSFAFLDSQARSFYRMGAPMDFLYRFDLQAKDLKQYDLVFMVNNFFLTDAETEKLVCDLENSGTTVVWFYAPAFVGPEKFEPGRMSRLTGFEFDITETPGPFMIDCSINDTAVEKGFGFERDLFPRFSVTDSNVQILGRWRDLQKPAFAGKKMAGWTSIYCGTAPLPPHLLRWLARRSGVELWSSKADIVFAAADCAVVIATQAGMRTLRFPAPLSRQNGTAGKREHDLDMEFGQVEMFFKPE